MANSGLATRSFNNQGAQQVTLTAVLQSSNSIPFTLKDYTMSSYILGGVYGGASLQWQGSNDNGTTWVNIGLPITTSSVQAGTLTPNSMFFGLYQLLITGGDGTTSINCNIRAVIPR